MNQTEQIIFLAIIGGYFLFWCVMIYLAAPKDKTGKKKKKYDERQQIEQGKAFQYAYFTLLCYLTVWAFLEKGLEIVWCDTIFGLALGAVSSLCVFMAYCVFRDAYFTLGESKAATLICVNLLGIVQLLLALEHIEKGTILQNGIITSKACGLLIFLMVAVLDVCVIARRQMEKRSS